MIQFSREDKDSTDSKALNQRCIIHIQLINQPYQLTIKRIFSGINEKVMLLSYFETIHSIMLLKILNNGVN